MSDTPDNSLDTYEDEVTVASDILASTVLELQKLLISSDAIIDAMITGTVIMMKTQKKSDAEIILSVRMIIANYETNYKTEHDELMKLISDLQPPKDQED